MITNYVFENGSVMDIGELEDMLSALAEAGVRAGVISAGK